MCQGCFNSLWEDELLTPTLFLQSRSPERQELIRLTGTLLEAEAAVPSRTGYWQGGRLHAAVDDDNYDLGPYIAPDDTDPLTPAEEHWLLLDELERSIVVAILVGYDIP